MSCGKFDADDFPDAEGAVCLVHILDPALASKMLTLATELTCIVCDREASVTEPAFAVPFGNLLGEIGAVLHHHYASAEDEGVPFDTEDWCYMGANTYQSYEVIEDICAGAFTDDISSKLIEKVVSEFPADITWTNARGADSSDAMDWAWEDFAETVQSRSRFIFVAGGSLADHSRASAGSAAFLGRLAVYVDGKLGLIDDLEAGAVFYRGRLMDAPWALKRECAVLQPPSPEKAAANPMSPAGIPMFYASADAQTAIAEIAGRSPQSSR